MDMSEMLSSGVELMLIGMFIVFSFLALLVLLVSKMTLLVEKYFPEDTILNMPMTSATTNETDSGIIAAISAAVHQYRNKDK